MQVLLLFVIPILAFSQSDLEWANYKTKYNKTYPTIESQSLHRQYWANQLSSIKQWNAIHSNSTNSVVLTYTQYTDFTDDQWYAFLGLIQDSATIARKSPSVSDTLPSSVNWMTKGKVTPSKNQGYCGASWAFAAAGLVQSYIAIYTGTLTSYSDQFVLECTSGGSCSSGSIGSGLQTIIQKGIPTQGLYPYTASKVRNGSPSPTKNICNGSKSNSLPHGSTKFLYRNLENDQMKLVLTNSPTASAIYATNLSVKGYSNGFYKCDRAVNNSQLNQAVLVYGYDSNGNYLIKNWWGKQWGYDGSMILDKDMDCGLKLQNWVILQVSSSSYWRRLIVGAIIWMVCTFAH